MAEYQVDDIEDPRLTPYRHLKRMNHTRWSGMFIAEGTRLVERLLKSDFPTLSILVGQNRRKRLPADIHERTDVFIAPQKLLEELIGYQFHAGMLACGSRKPTPRFEDWVPASDRPALLVGCPHTTDPDNLGTIIRVAAALGADGFLVGSASADPFARRTLRISMGNAFVLPIFESEDFSRDMQRLQTDFDFVSVATVLDPTAIRLAEAARPRRMLLLMGNEDDGLDAELSLQSDLKVMIPMADRVDSLNVGVAAGIILHHFTQVAPMMQSGSGS